MPPVRTTRSSRSDAPYARSSALRRDSESVIEDSDNDDIGVVECLAPSISTHSRSLRSAGNLSGIFIELSSYSPKKKMSKLPKMHVASPHVDPITVNGQKLQPTAAFDTFWRFVCERQIIEVKRRAGLPPPWTDNPILQEQKFCNTFRVLDRLSQYIITDVIEKGSQDPTELLFRIVLFNTFTKIHTWEYLQEKLGPLTWTRYNRKKYQNVLSQIVDEGHTLYTGAFQKPAPRLDFEYSYMNHLLLLEMLMADLPDVLANAKYAADIFEEIAAFPGMANFTAYQLMLNISYSKLFRFSNMDFVIPGIGASSGLVKLFGRSIVCAKESSPNFEVDVIRWMASNQKHQFARLGLDFPGLGPKRLPMDLADMEHAICEVDKYCRVAHPKIKGLHARTKLRGVNWRPSTDPYPANPTIPKAWADPRRKKIRVRPDANITVAKRYVIDHIVSQRVDENGDLEYLIHWFNYPVKDRTWEPAEDICEEAPEAVQDFLRKERA